MHGRRGAALPPIAAQRSRATTAPASNIGTCAPRRTRRSATRV